MPPLKEWLRFLIPKKLLTRHPILLVQNKSWKRFNQTIKWNQEVVDKKLKYEIGFIIGNNECLAKHTIKNKISKLLSNYKYGNHISEHEKQKTVH